MFRGYDSSASSSASSSEEEGECRGINLDRSESRVPQSAKHRRTRGSDDNENGNPRSGNRKEVKPHQSDAESAPPMRKRIRTIEHVEGNFPTIVYIKVPPSPDLDAARSQCASTLRNPEDNLKDIHISLCPLILLRQHFIEPFVEKLKSIIMREEEFECYFDDCIDIYANDEKTRYFSGIPVLSSSASPLTKIRNAVAVARASFPCNGIKDPKEPYRFHMSLASSLETPDLIAKNVEAKGGSGDADQRSWTEVSSLPSLDLSVEVNHIIVRAGKRDYIIPLRATS